MSEQDIKNHAGIGRVINKKTTALDRVTPTILSYEARLIAVENDLGDNFLKKNATDEPTSTETFDLGSTTKKWNSIYSVNFIGTSSSAKYADLAEKYTIDCDIPEDGRVVTISQNPNVDCEISNRCASKSVLGVISKDPAFKMNAESDGTFIALKGRLECYVKGPVYKGEPLVSFSDGCAIGINAINHICPGMIFGKSLEAITNDDIVKIEIVI